MTENLTYSAVFFENHIIEFSSVAQNFFQRSENECPRPAESINNSFCSFVENQARLTKSGIKVNDV